MASILVRNVPEHIHRRLKVKARQNRRSLAAEILVLLEDSLAQPAGPLSSEELDRVRVKGAFPLTEKFLQEAIDKGRP